MTTIQEAKAFVRCKGTVKVDGSLVQCDREANVPGSALGFCVRCYKRHRKNQGPEDVKTIAAPGEGDDAEFRVTRTKRDQVKREAKRRGCTESELYREALDLWLAVLHGTKTVVEH